MNYLIAPPANWDILPITMSWYLDVTGNGGIFPSKRRAPSESSTGSYSSTDFTITA